MNAWESVGAPRIHHQWRPDRVRCDDALDPAIRRELESRGHTVAPTGPFNAVQVVVRTDRGFEAASDPRKGGVPAGVDLHAPLPRR